MKHILHTILFFSFAGPGLTQTLDTSLWITNGPVNAVARHGNNLYIGGKFDYVGKSSGFGIIADTVLKQAIPNFPKVNGPVYVVHPDHQGGFYIGGSFTNVGGYRRNNMARINRDGNVNASFNADVNGPVYAITTDLKKGANQFVFAGGAFNIVNGIACSNFISMTPWGTPYEWYPKITGTVRAICVYDTTYWEPGGRYQVTPIIYVGGEFNSVEGRLVNNFAAFGYPKPKKPVVVFTFINPQPDKAVRCIHRWKNYILVGGDFTKIGIKNYSNFAIIQAWDGQVPNFNFAVNGPVYSITGSRYIPPPNTFVPPGGPGFSWEYNTLSASVYIAGNFSSVSNQTRNGFAEIDMYKKQITPFAIQTDGKVSSVNTTPYGTILLAGDFKNVNGNSREYFAEYDTASKSITGWKYNLSNSVNVVAFSGYVNINPAYPYISAVTGDKVFTGGNFNSMDGVKRLNLAALDMQTGSATAFNPEMNGAVNTMLLHNDVLYMSGDFTKAGTSSRMKLAAIDMNTQLLSPWNLTTDGTVRCMKADGQRLYLGGFFSRVGVESRNNIACYVIDSSNVSTWNPDVNGTVNDLVIANDKVYAGGYFTKIGNFSRNYLAAIETGRGLATTWDPELNNGVYTLAESAGRLYAGGWFDSIAREPVKSLAAFDLQTESRDNAWKLDVDKFAKSISVSDERLFALGEFSQVNGSVKDRFVEIDIPAIQPTGWVPILDHTYGTLKKTMIKAEGTTLYIGGSFITAEDRIQSYLAVYSGLVTGLRDEEKNASLPGMLKIYPNPASESIQVEATMPPSREIILKITDLTGRVVYRMKSKSPEILSKSIPVSAFPSGIYILELESENHRFQSKFIKR